MLWRQMAPGAMASIWERLGNFVAPTYAQHLDSMLRAANFDLPPLTMDDTNALAAFLSVLTASAWKGQQVTLGEVNESLDSLAGQPAWRQALEIQPERWFQDAGEILSREWETAIEESPQAATIVAAALASGFDGTEQDAMSDLLDILGQALLTVSFDETDVVNAFDVVETPEERLPDEDEDEERERD